MVARPRVVTVNLDRYEPSLAEKFACITLNLDIRDRDSAEARNRVSRAMNLADNGLFALRIDSALRGHVGMLVEAALQRGDAMITDTIPEYGRRTLSGMTFAGKEAKSLESLFANHRGRSDLHRLIISDSETYEDIDTLAEQCTRAGLIPIDPGPLVAKVVQTWLGHSNVPMPSAGSPSRVAFVIGTRHPKTLKQIRHMRKLGFPVQIPSSKKPEEVDIFSFSMGKERGLITKSFVHQLTNYDALVLSGGETANYVLEWSGFEYIVGGPQVRPLVSSGVVKGGLFDGKQVVLKGGLIGDEKTYKTILDWLRKK